MAKLYTFHIFNALGECLYYREWARERPCVDEAIEHKTLFGLFFTMKDFSRQLDPTKTPESDAAKGGNNFYAFTTNNYKLHYFETASGLRFLLTTDPGAGDFRTIMHNIYLNLYVEYIVKNPSFEARKPFSSAAFDEALDAFAGALVSSGK